ncbi:MAG: hypothetical protein K9L30_18565 [Desulfobacterales bacterium]|nr:hypothetical protein [Desulfobacterales bacterium]
MIRKYKVQEIMDFVKPIRMFNCNNNFMNVIRGFAPIKEAKKDELSFCNEYGKPALDAIMESEAGILLCHDDIPGIENCKSKACIFTVKNPRFSFIRFANHFSPIHNNEKFTHPTAIVEKDTIIGKNVYIGRYAYVGHNVVIGNNTMIQDRVHIGEGSKIGDNVILQTGAVIGCEGQGFERNEDGSFEKFPQKGWVVIEDNVEVGANSTIVRGTFGETLIGTGTKIGHLCDIGHNVKIGNHVFISAAVVVCGSSIVGNYTWLAPKCCIKNKIVVGDRATVGLGSVVIENIDDGVTVVGVPARKIQKEKK